MCSSDLFPSHDSSGSFHSVPNICNGCLLVVKYVLSALNTVHPPLNSICNVPLLDISLMILVGVVLDTLQQVESHLLMRHYDGLLNSGRIKGRSGNVAAY